MIIDIEKKFLDLGWVWGPRSSTELPVLCKECMISGNYIAYNYNPQDNKLSCSVDYSTRIIIRVSDIERIDEALDFIDNMIKLSYDYNMSKQEMKKFTEFVKKQDSVKVATRCWDIKLKTLCEDLRIRVTIGGDYAIVSLRNKSESIDYNHPEQSVILTAQVLSLEQLKEFMRAAIFFNGNLETAEL